MECTIILEFYLISSSLNHVLSIVIFWQDWFRRRVSLLKPLKWKTFRWWRGKRFRYCTFILWDRMLRRLWNFRLRIYPWDWILTLWPRFVWRITYSLRVNFHARLPPNNTWRLFRSLWRKRKLFVYRRYCLAQ